MKSLFEILKCLALAALVAFLLAGTSLIWVTRTSEIDSRQVVTHVDSAAIEIGKSVVMVNQALKGTHANGDDGLLEQTRLLVSNAREAMNATKQTMQTVNRTSKAEQEKTVELTDSSIALVKSATGAVARLDGAAGALTDVIAKTGTVTLPKIEASVDSLNGLVSDLRPTAKASTELVEELTDTVGTVKVSVGTANALLADPELAGIIHNLNSMSEKSSVVAGNLGLVTMDVHNILNPKKLTFMEALAETVARSAFGAILGPLLSHFLPGRFGIVNTVSVSPITK